MKEIEVLSLNPPNRPRKEAFILAWSAYDTTIFKAQLEEILAEEREAGIREGFPAARKIYSTDDGTSSYEYPTADDFIRERSK
jgi:hypothetical protein